MIHVQSLTKYYNDLCAVDQINFEIQKGEIVGLLGPNGAGKTTTLRMLTGYLTPTYGSIEIKGYSVDKNSLEVKKIMGYLPESAPLYHDMFVYDYLCYVADIRGLNKLEKEFRLKELADLCGINEVMHKSISELSKGYKQRVGLAHAMLNDPEILILDEPTSGLDPNQIVEIRDIIKQIGKEKTVILSTHILPEAEATCDRIVIINGGKIATDASMESLKQSAKGEYLVNASIKGAAFEDVEKRFMSIDGVVNVSRINERDGVLMAQVTCKSSSADLCGDIYLNVKETDWLLLELHQETQSLENIFRDFTKES